MKFKKRFLAFLLCFAMIVTAVPVYAENTVSVYVTIAVAGNVATAKDNATKVAYQEVTVADTNSNSGIDIDDVLYAAHELFFDGGAAKGYSSNDSAYGLSLGTLWGTTEGVGGYRLNNGYVATSLAEPVKDGDYIVAYTYADTNSWSDVYSYFDKTVAEVNVGEELELTMNYQSYDESWNLTDQLLAGASLTIDGTASEIKTDENGKAVVSFENPGTYVISAVSENKILVPAVCKVTVNANQNEETGTVKITTASDLPQVLEAEKTYELANDITLEAGQQIETLAGVLDGKGHTITLADKPLANNVAGTIQNIGILSTDTLNLSGYAGSMAMTLSGTIQNSYSLADMTTSGYDDIGGLVGTLSGGSIYNSYYAGNNTAMFADGLVGYATGGTVANCCYCAGYSPIGMGGNSVTKTNVIKKSTSEMTQSDAVTVLNSDIIPTGYQWKLPVDGSNKGFPVLTKDIGEVIIDKSGLEAVLDAVKQMSADQYTEESWNNLSNAAAEAESVFNDENAVQADINRVLRVLEDAMNTLEKKKPTEPVALPEDEEQIVHITSQTQLEYGITAGDPSKYYVLDTDLELNDMYWNFDTFEGVLDGKGHTITFHSSRTGLFANIGSNGVIQNLHFAGDLNADAGACGTEMKGAVLNCYTEVSGSNASGFAKRLNGGVISNCYSLSAAEDGAIIEQTKTASGAVYTGTLKNVYWKSDLVQPVDLEQLTIQGSTGACNASFMKSLEFVAALNENKGIYGISWGQNSNGYPYFGENQEYAPEENLPENKTEIAFTLNESTTAEKIENQELFIDRNKANDWDIVGIFSLPEYSALEDAYIQWDTPDTDDSVMDIDMSTGELFVYKDGEGVVTATLVNGDGSTELLASVKVTVSIKQIEDIQLYLSDAEGVSSKEIQDGKATVKGSESKRILIKAKYVGEDTYQAISTNDFTFAVTDPANIVKHTENSSVFRFIAPGTAAMSVTYNVNDQITKSVELTSEYVAVESVKPGMEGTVVIHGRNANSSDDSHFLPEYANVIVEPANASYVDSYAITSSDPSIAAYVDSMVKGYVPYKAGTVTYTAAINDNGTEKSGTSKVTYVYKNPLTKVTIAKDKINLKKGEEVSAGLVFEGTLTDGHSITETGMNWSFDKEGIVSILRENGAFKREETAPDNGYYFLSEEYTIKALAQGTVTVTGNPIDTTGGAEPVVFTVSVDENSDLQPANIDQIIHDGIAASAKYLTNDMTNSPVGMVHGYEWHVITLLRAGKEIDQALLDTYYESVVDEIKTWDGSEKPTDIERTALALTLMGKDIKDIEGMNLAEMIYNSEHLSDGANELAFALLALDAVDTEIPNHAKWNRSSIIEELYKFQKTDGSFSLNPDDTTGSIDITSMCLQALAPYREDQQAADAITSGLEYLRDKISGKYDYDSNANSTAQVLLTLAVLGIDVTDQKEGFGNLYENLITGLDTYAVENGFLWKQGDAKVNTAATYQAMQALDAYKKIHEDGISYWDFTDIYEKNPDDQKKNPFKDVEEGTYYYKSILWAVKKNIAYGYSEDMFRPELSCTRGQAVTFLWRAFGSPEPKNSTTSFTDIKEDAYYYKPVLWAVEQGITAGVTNTKFAPEDTVTRGQIVSLLYRAVGEEAEIDNNPFVDVAESTYYYKPILWAYANDVTAGLTKTTFGPEEFCTRGQIVTFLYRVFEK